MTELGLLLEQLRVRTGGAIAHQLRVDGIAVEPSDADGVLTLVRTLGPAAARYEPRAVAATAAFHRALDLGVEREQALAFLLSGAADAVAGSPGLFENGETASELRSQMPGLLERFDTTTAEGRTAFDELVRDLFPEAAMATGRVAPTQITGGGITANL